MIIAQTRSAFGDPQPPSYDYWTARLNAGDTNWSRFYIAVIWISWFIQFYILIILLLNLLISIVSETYNQILEIEVITKFKGRLDLNEHYANEFYFSDEMNKTIYQMVFCTKSADAVGGADEDDKGTTKRIKKQLNKFERDVKEELKNIKMQGKLESQDIKDETQKSKFQFDKFQSDQQKQLDDLKQDLEKMRKIHVEDKKYLHHILEMVKPINTEVSDEINKFLT